MLDELYDAGAGACAVLLRRACAQQRNSQWDQCRDAALMAREHAWEQLHSGPSWQAVNAIYRQAYGVAGLLVAITTFLQGDLGQAVFELDLVALMAGGPFQQTANRFVEQMETHAGEDEASGKAGTGRPLQPVVRGTMNGPSDVPSFLPRAECSSSGGHSSGESTGKRARSRFRLPGGTPAKRSKSAADGGQDLPGHCLDQQPVRDCDEIPRVHCPSLASFQQYMETATPVILTGVMDHWPALGHPEQCPDRKEKMDGAPGTHSRAWSDLSYLRRIAGRRTVPVEVGGCYTGDGWRQELMTVGCFIDRFIDPHPLPTGKRSSARVVVGQGGGEEHKAEGSPARAANKGEGDSDANPAPAARGSQRLRQLHQVHTPVGYLAQHQLLDQIPALRRDIVIPDYCALGLVDEGLDRDGEVAVNAWFGPGGTVSPLHNDPTHNLLAQVVGSKMVTIVDRARSWAVYPREGLMSNTSAVDAALPDLERFPKFAEASPAGCVLRAGEVLYIPPLFWHHIEALEVSFSVSFWWGKRRTLSEEEVRVEASDKTLLQ
ncbi:unnamed protein product [Discosporangium mesarthrocarpum]